MFANIGICVSIRAGINIKMCANIGMDVDFGACANLKACADMAEAADFTADLAGLGVAKTKDIDVAVGAIFAMCVKIGIRRFDSAVTVVAEVSIQAGLLFDFAIDAGRVEGVNDGVGIDN